jgi:membrane protein
VAASILFSWFISMSTRYSLVYGSLVSIVVMMVWLYLCGNILLAGNILSSVWYQEHGEKWQFRHELD